MARKDADRGAKARKAEKMRAALEYKKAGATVRFIADRLDIGVATAQRYITEALEQLREQTAQSTQELVALESERIDQARFAIAAKVVRGELDAIDRWLKASSEYRKLHGLDKPTSLALTDPSGEAMWQPFDRKRLASLSPEQLEQFENILAILTSEAANDGTASDDKSSDGLNDEESGEDDE